MNSRNHSDKFVPPTEDVTFTLDDVLRLQHFTEQLLYLSSAITDTLKKYDIYGNNY